MPPQKGYERIRALLKEWFGDEFVISQAWVQKVMSVLWVKGKEGLQFFSDDLTNFHETLLAMDTMAELNIQGSLPKIIERLPAYLGNRWRRELIAIKVKQHRLPNLRDVDFVAMAALEANHPVFGDKQPVLSSRIQKINYLQ